MPGCHVKKPIYDEPSKAQAVALYNKLHSLRAVSIQLGIARSTLRRWVCGADLEKSAHRAGQDGEGVHGINAPKSVQTARPNGGAGMRQADDGDFLGSARLVLGDALLLLRQQIQTALHAQDALDKLLKSIQEDGDTPQKERVETAKVIAKMARPDMRELMSAFGSLYDRQTEDRAGCAGRAPDLSGLSTDEIRTILANCGDEK